MQVLDKGYVKVIEKGCWGSDALVIESARMSTNGGFVSWDPYEGHPKGDLGLLKYLWDHKHTTPFEMAGATFEIYAPIFVIREWQRHRVQALSEGLSFNEMSGRYVELPDEYYVPSLERLMGAKQSSVNKQGSGAGFMATQAQTFAEEMQATYAESRGVYEWMLEQGVAREVARMVLPVSQYSRMRVSANLWGWLQFLILRLPPNVQWETRQYAQTVSGCIAELFPQTWELFARDQPR